MQHIVGVKVTWKELVMKIKAENILLCQEKKYHALRMFAKRITERVLVTWVTSRIILLRQRKK
jgi:hypothetical protein